MAVVIKNMEEVPKTCSECTLCIESTDREHGFYLDYHRCAPLKVHLNHAMDMGKGLVNVKLERHPRCPLANATIEDPNPLKKQKTYGQVVSLVKRSDDSRKKVIDALEERKRRIAAQNPQG